MQQLWKNARHKKKFLKKPSKLSYYYVYYRENARKNLTSNISWNTICNLESIKAQNITVDMGVLLQNEKLKEITLQDCDMIWTGLEESFSSLQALESFDVTVSEIPEEPFLKVLDFGNNELLDRVSISSGIAQQVILPSMKTDVYYGWDSEKGRCKFTFMDEKNAGIPSDLPEGAVLLNEEKFPDELFRQYLYLYVDTNQDRVLSLEEREAVTRIRNDDADYDKDAF